MILRIAASRAKAIALGRSQPTIHGHAFVEDETLAFELAIGILGQVTENPIAKLIDLVEAPRSEIEHDFLASDSTGAEDHHGSLGIQSRVIGEGAPLREVVDFRIDRAPEGADLGLVPVARIDEDMRLARGEHSMPFLRCQVPVLLRIRRQVGPLHRHDLLADIDPRVPEWGGIRNGVLVADISPDEVLEGFDLLGGTRDGSVDSFGGQQDLADHSSEPSLELRLPRPYLGRGLRRELIEAGYMPGHGIRVPSSDLAGCAVGASRNYGK